MPDKRVRLVIMLAALAAVLPIKATHAEGLEAQQVSAVPPVFLERLNREQKLQDIGWRLTTANARFCEGAIPSIGMQIHDMASYSDPDAVRELFGLKSDFAVLTVATGSPADKAGLATNLELLAIDDELLSEWPAAKSRDWQRTARAHDLVDAKLKERGQVTLLVDGDRDVSIYPELACASRFELSGDSKRAIADGNRVILGNEFPGFSYAEDELAAAIAHELAHNVLKHRVWLDEEGRGRKNVRLTEREADRLMPWLLANAGYDPDAAIRFMRRWGPRHGGWIFRKRTHDGWDERVEFIEAELVRIAEVRGKDGAADWHTHFMREIAQP
jgi:hypothetical protein